MEYTVEHAQKCLSVIDAGLVSGLGQAEPGKMCVEAAICYALGLPHGDDPGCVSSAVRSFKIALNDKWWSSDTARAAGLRALAIAQLGSKSVIDDIVFARRLTKQIIRVIVPIALRTVAQRVPFHAAVLETAAEACEREGTPASALKARDAASTAAAAAADADADAAAAAYAAADAAAYAAADADADARDAIFAKAASLAFDVLREMGAPGVALWDAVNAA